MIERAIENWLTNTNERNYQTPFCQALMAQGQTVLYRSLHRPMEQGKDLITRDESGGYHAYQLKTGNINLRVWGDIKREIDDLIELSIVHPSVPRDAAYRSYLVCNGDITDEVRYRITQMNDDNTMRERGCAYLDVITFPKLLTMFIDAQSSFLPNTVEDFVAFAKIHSADGRDFIDKDALTQFLSRSVLTTGAKSISNRKHAVSSSVVLMSHMLMPYQDEENHFALFEAWVLLAAAILKYAESENLKVSWRESFDLALGEAIGSLLRLKQETLTRTDFLERDLMGDGGDMYRGRLTTVFGAIAALELQIIDDGTCDAPDEKVVELMVDNLHKLWLWGESALPFLLNVVWVLERANLLSEAKQVLASLFSGILLANGRYLGSAPPLAPPYYSLSQVIETLYGLTVKPIDFKAFAGGSYGLEVVVQAMARRRFKELLEPNWARATHVRLQEFLPIRTEDYFSWRAAEGKNAVYSFPETQSWQTLVEHSCRPNDGLLSDNSTLLRMFTLVAPHRFTKEAAAIVDPYKSSPLFYDLEIEGNGG